jgi:hypothetical protein
VSATTVYAVWAGHDDGEDFTGYAYTTRELAEAHASRAWNGSVREIEVYDALPNWVRAIPSRGRP